jgi:hypothetical protein
MPRAGYKSLLVKTITHKAATLWAAQLTQETGGKVSQDLGVLCAIAVASRHPEQVHAELRARMQG